MDIVMPQLGETVSEGTVTQWLKKAGDSVKRDELLFVVGTDKAEMEIPAPADGVLSQILVQEGETVAVGTRLAVIGGDAAPTPAPAAAEQRLSPVVKKLLAEHGLTADQVKGTGDGGRITREDVLAYVAAKKPAVPAGPAIAETVAFTYRRKMIAEHMMRSLETSAHVVQAIEVEFDAVEKARGSLSYLPFIAKALCGAIRDFPRVNATVDKDRLVVYRDINIAIAVDLAHEGLVTPVIRNADALSVAEIADSIKGFAEKARANTLKPEEMAHGTYTISNSGAYGTLFTASIINQPQVAILSTDGVKRKPVVHDEKIVIRSIGVLAQSFDHRAFDGAYSAAFLKRLKDIFVKSDWLF
jgi:2-oxoglutarate dehydrogenase E2 component (dihydrolipoamide succinyltransferase)